MTESDRESEISWPESIHDGVAIPITPTPERTTDVLGKRKREEVHEPKTPSSQRVKQLDTPPNSGRHKPLAWNESPSRRAALDKSRALATELENNATIGSLGSKVKLHIHKQDRLLEASLRARDVLRNLLKVRESEILALRGELKVYRNERETQRAMSSALRREIAHLENYRKEHK